MTGDVSPEMKKFAEDLARKRMAQRPKGIASPGFVDRMTSSAADPDAAQREATAEDGTQDKSEGRS
ncbi:MAG: hypothetical protein AAGE89_04235 [Pseudomonadota bacterium]